jgi:fatty-acid desaturase
LGSFQRLGLDWVRHTYVEVQAPMTRLSGEQDLGWIERTGAIMDGSASNSLPAATPRWLRRGRTRFWATASKRPVLDRPATVTGQVVWRYVIPIAVMHSLALLALIPWLFSWTGVVLLLVGTYVFGGLGINIAYHRLLTHRSFKCPLWLERFFVIVAQCCLEDAPASWVATHRLHHNDSDHHPDPHSPLVNFLWAHVGWLFWENPQARSVSAYDRYARDVLRDPFYFRLQRSLLSIWIYLAHAVAYFLIGFGVEWVSSRNAETALQFGLSVLVWGVILRTVCVWHITWSVNSVTHLFGYRSYETSDNSRNNWIVALLANGEGWHNNHHIDPASASNRHRWWELDTVWIVIRGLELVGLATDVIRPRHQRREESTLIAQKTTGGATRCAPPAHSLSAPIEQSSPMEPSSMSTSGQV